MICVAADSEDSLESIAKWKAEIESVEPGKPIVLVFTKSDLEDGVTV